MRCKAPRNNDCGFFIWEEDEPAQRSILGIEDQPASQNPSDTQHRNSSPKAPQTPHTPHTPHTLHTPPSSRIRSAPTTRLYRRDSSPTPNRKDDTRLAGSSQLTKDVLDLLQLNNISLKSSIREQLRHLIDSEVRIHETELKNFQESVSNLGDLLDKTEMPSDK